MIGKTSTQNNRQGLTAQSSVTGNQEFLLSTNGVLQTTGGGTGGGGAITTSAKGTTAAGSPTSTAASANRQPLDVTLYDTSGNPASIGGGSQYTDGAMAITHPIGTYPVFTNASNLVTAVSSTNPLPVSASVTPAPNLISTANSTTTILTAGSTFTGTSEDASAYADIRISVFSDVASATDGLSLQQSTNGTNWDNVDTFTIAASTGKAFDVPVYARYFRVVYTNGATNQATFRLQTVYHIQRTKPSSQRPMDARSNDNDMEENLSYEMVYSAAGNNWNRVKDIGTAGVPGVGITDGTNTANVVVGDAGFNGIATAATTKSLTFSSTGSGAQMIGPFNAEGFSWITVHITANTTAGLAMTGQFSATSGGTFSNASSWGNTSPGTPSALGATNGQFYISPVIDNFFQINITALTSGTISGTITLSNKAASYPQITASSVQSGTWTVGSNSATGSAVPANAFYVGMTDGTNLNGLRAANLADSTSGGGAILAAGGYIWNGTTYDRQRAANAATGTTGTGLLGAGVLTFDGTNWNSLRPPTGDGTGASQALQAGNIIFNGTAWDRQRSATAASNTTGTGLLGNGILGFDGTNYQRIKTDATGNLFLGAGTNSIGIVDTELPAPAALADGTTNPTITSVGSFGQVFNGATWERMRGDLGDGSAATGVLVDNPLIYNGTTYDRVRSATAVSNTTGTGVPAAGVLGFDGTNYQRLATDTGGTVNVVQKAATATSTNVASSATSVTLLAANTARKGGSILNESTAVLYIKFGTTASLTSYKVALPGSGVAPYSYFEISAGYTGRIDGIWASAVGTARIDEET